MLTKNHYKIIETRAGSTPTKYLSKTFQEVTCVSSSGSSMTSNSLTRLATGFAENEVVCLGKKRKKAHRIRRAH